MFNLLKMDLRRLFRNRSFYVLLGISAALVIMLTAMVSAVLDPNKLKALTDSGMVVTGGSSEVFEEEIRSMTKLDFVHECLSSGFSMIMVGIGVTLFVHSDFSSGYIKNICFVRPRRREYVMSKILAAGVYSGIITVLNVMLSLLCTSLFWIPSAASPVFQILQYMFFLWLANWAFGLMGLLFVLLTRSSTLGIAMSVFSGGGLVAMLLQNLCLGLGWPNLSQYLLSMVAADWCAPALGTEQMITVLCCSAGWAAFYIAGSFLMMEKRDI